jgi:acetylglutamate kinase
VENSTKYTPEQEQELVKMYLEGHPVETLAQRFNKSNKSIIAKLARLGVYKREQKQSNRVTKADLVGVIALALGVDRDLIATIEKADKVALETLASAIEGQVSGLESPG